MSKIAPRTPESDRVFNCEDANIKSTKLSYDIGVDGFKRAEDAYNGAKDDLKEAQSSNNARQISVNNIASEIASDKLLLAAAQSQVTALGVKFDAANTDVMVCNNNPDTCTIAEKSIKVQVSNKALELMLANSADISKYTTDIADNETLYTQKNGQLDVIKAGTAAEIATLEGKVTDAETIYANKREVQRRTFEDYDELHIECKFNSFHQNHLRMEELLESLEDYGMVAATEGSQPQSNGGDYSAQYNVAGYDCRYKDIPQCQGASFLQLNDASKDACRKAIDPVCYEKTYATFWILDLLSFFWIPPSLGLCLFNQDFSYSLCSVSGAYVLVLTLLGYIGVDY